MARQTDSNCACAGVAREPGFWNAAKYGASASLQPLLLEDEKLNAAVTLGVQGGRQESLLLRKTSHQLVLCSQGVIAIAGHEVPLSVALDRTTPVVPVEILGNQTGHPSGGDLLILVAVTSTCCTMQVCLQHQHVVGVLLHKGALRLHWRPCRQPCPFMQAQHRRNAIRQSWALTMAKSPSPVDLKFVLAQPNDSKIADAHSLLQVQSVTYVASFCCFDRSFCTHAVIIPSTTCKPVFVGRNAPSGHPICA